MVEDTSALEGKLLVPVANPETATRQLDTAIDVATDRSYGLVLLFVLEVPPQLSLQDGRRYLLEDEHEELLADAATMAEEAGVPVERRIRIARSVAKGILGAIETYDADAVLLGWRGRPPREEVVLGSHLDTVLKKAPCDVVVKRIQTPGPETVDSVLVPVAGGPHDALATEVAGSIARQHDATVHLLHVMARRDPELPRREADRLLWTKLRHLDSIDVERTVIEADDVAGSITDRTVDHDITVLGVSRGGFLERRLLGTISEAVGRHAAGTVILTKRHESVPSRLGRLLS